ncbi:MAG: helix-turn-helix domain-containing protein [Lachnospiraceae bacterium]|nr:helix-turn-helix domain-containing protein [Lachnospiraceae bacterium]
MDGKLDLGEKAVWSARDLVRAGFTRSMAYALLNREDVPTIRIGGRLFVRREAFQDWLKRQEKADA